MSIMKLEDISKISDLIFLFFPFLFLLQIMCDEDSVKIEMYMFFILLQLVHQFASNAETVC